MDSVWDDGAYSESEHSYGPHEFTSCDLWGRDIVQQFLWALRLCSEQ